MTRMWNAVASSLVVAAVCAGGGGLLIANSTHADVEILKTQAPAVEARMQKVEQGLASVKAATDVRAKHDKEFREEQRQVNADLNRKLDALLEIEMREILLGTITGILAGAVMFNAWSASSNEPSTIRPANYKCADALRGVSLSPEPKLIFQFAPGFESCESAIVDIDPMLVRGDRCILIRFFGGDEVLYCLPSAPSKVI